MNGFLRVLQDKLTLLNRLRKQGGTVCWTAGIRWIIKRRDRSWSVYRPQRSNRAWVSCIKRRNETERTLLNSKYNHQLIFDVFAAYINKIKMHNISQKTRRKAGKAPDGVKIWMHKNKSIRRAEIK